MPTEAAQKPDWLETPDETEYDLVMSGEAGSSVQTVNLSREEYIALKEYLCKLRGLKPVQPSGASI
jgi:hypothetical protein